MASLPLRKRPIEPSNKIDHDDSSDDNASLSSGSDGSPSPTRYSYPKGYPPPQSQYPPYDSKGPVSQAPKRQKPPPGPSYDSGNTIRQPRIAALNAKKYVEHDDDSDEDDEDEDEEDEPAPPKKANGPARPTEPVYCFCRKPDHGGFMICCDVCEEWYHSECVQINEARSKQIAKYVCEKCDRKGQGRTEFYPNANATTLNIDEMRKRAQPQMSMPQQMGGMPLQHGGGPSMGQPPPPSKPRPLTQQAPGGMLLPGLD